MTVAQLIRELEGFQPDSEVLLAVPAGLQGWNNAAPAVLYWNADAHKVIVEGEQP